MNSDEMILAAPPLPLAPDVMGEEDYEEGVALRWRNAILRLSETFLEAADERSDLSPVLLEAMHNALNNLLVYGEAGDLMVLEEWLSMEEEGREQAAAMRGDTQRPQRSRGGDRRQGDRRRNILSIAIERRIVSRRERERRAVADWQFEAIPMAPAS